MNHCLQSLSTGALALLCLCGCTAAKAPAEGTPEPSPSASERVLPQAGTESAAPSQSVEQSEQPSELAVEPYWFGQPVEESDAAEDEYFSNAVFLGDSRTEGLQLYGGLHAGDFFWYKGMTVFQADDPEYRKIEVDGECYTLLEALALKDYAKVYIMIGVNELGYAASSYKKGLTEMVRRVKEIQPQAVVYLQTLPPVNESKAVSKKLGSYINNTNVRAFNRVVWEVAWEEKVALLDVASAFYTDRGDLAEDMAADGVHFYRKGYELWRDYLKCHVLAAARYAAGTALAEKPEPDLPPLVSAPPAESTPGVPESSAPEVSPEVTPEVVPTEEPVPTAGPEETPAPSESLPPAQESSAPEVSPEVTPPRRQRPLRRHLRSRAHRKTEEICHEKEFDRPGPCAGGSFVRLREERAGLYGAGRPGPAGRRRVYRRDGKRGQRGCRAALRAGPGDGWGSRLLYGD